MLPCPQGWQGSLARNYMLKRNLSQGRTGNPGTTDRMKTHSMRSGLNLNIFRSRQKVEPAAHLHTDVFTIGGLCPNHFRENLLESGARVCNSCHKQNVI
jgi:hypothetical protein